jgi:signal transduction histidine kinase
MENEIARLDRLNLVGEMAASIGHEIRNPMTSVRGFLQMLGSKEEYHDDQTYFDLMIVELDRANAIISEYLNMAKGKNINPYLQSLNSIIETIHPIIESDANLREIKVELHLNKIPNVMIDKNEIKQLILNIARNGLEAMSYHGKLTIGTYIDSESIVIYIQDEGPGLATEILDKLGTPFISTKTNGTGLGLAICYSIAKRHNAKLDYQTGPNGTTFFVLFPIR